MEFSITAAIWGALVGASVLFAALVYLRAMPDPPAGAGFWTVAFGLHVVRLASYLIGGSLDPATAIWIGESLQAASGLLLLAGTLCFAGKRVPGWLVPLGLASVVLWAGYTSFIENDFRLRSIPLYGLSGAALIFAGYIMLRVRDVGVMASAKLVGVVLIAWGLHKLDYPWLRPVEWFAPFGFLLGQALAMGAAVALLLLMAGRLHVLAADAQRQHAQSREYLQTLNQLLEVSLGGKPLQAQLSQALDIIIAAPWLALEPRGAIFLTKDDHLELAVERNLDPQIRQHCAQVAFDDCLCGRAAARREVLHAGAAEDGCAPPAGSLEPPGHYAVPVISGEEVLAVLMLYQPDRGRRHVSEGPHLRAVADAIAGMIVRKQAQAETDASRSRLVAAQRIARIGSWEVDLVNNKALWSDEEFRILGYEPGEIEPTHEAFLARVHPDDRAAVVTAMAEAKCNGRLAIDHRILHPDGTVLHVSDRAELDCDESGRVLRFYGTLQDVTQQKIAERALVQAKRDAELANQAKTAFLANMSHELRTPLNAVIGFAQLLERPPRGGRITPEQQQKNQQYVGFIRESGEHLLAVINDILDVCRIEAGGTKLAEDYLDMAELVQGTVQLMNPKAQAGGLTLEQDVADDLPAFSGDARAIKQILFNLVGNAVKFTEAGGKVLVSLRVVAGGLELSVRDSGIGIASEDLGRIFEPFVQAESELNRRFEGTGLGLPLTKSLVEMHGGRMSLDSAPNRGTTVTVLFPASRLADPAPMRQFG